MDAISLFTQIKDSALLTPDYLQAHGWRKHPSGLLEFDSFKNKRFWTRFFITVFKDGDGAYKQKSCVIRGKTIEGDVVPLGEISYVMQLNELVASLGLGLTLDETVHGWKPWLFPDYFDIQSIMWKTTPDFDDSRLLAKSEHKTPVFEQMWEKARIVDGLDKDLFRMDACGAIIRKDYLAEQNHFGWVIDTIDPKGGQTFENQRPLHCINDYMKGNDYPSYLSAVRYDGVYNVCYENNMTIKKTSKL